MGAVIVPWLIVWALCNTPHVAPWNGWFVSLIVALVLL